MSDGSVDAYDVAIILGARVRPDGSPSPALVRRVNHGVELLRAGRVGALLMTGGVTGVAVAEAVVMRALALAAGVPSTLIHMEDRARNTIENALLTAPVMRAAGWRRALVVTDSFHGIRAGYIFRRFGLRVTVAGVRPDRPTAQWRLAHIRELCAMPWTILRVESRLLQALRSRRMTLDA